MKRKKFVHYTVILACLACDVGFAGSQSHQSSTSTPSPTTSSLACNETSPIQTAAQTWKTSVEAGELFGFVVSIAGQPETCQLSWEPTGLGPRGKLVYGFSREMTLTAEVMPPEISILRARAKQGFDDKDAARTFLRQWAKEAGLNVDWTRPEEREEDDTTVQTYWDPEPGLNGGVDEVWRGDRLVGLGLHLAP